MYSFNNDYSEGAHPRILKALMETNLEQNDGYSMDRHTAHAAALIRAEASCPDAGVHILTGGTQTNSAVIAAALRPHQAVIAASTGHINVHETGAAEASGHKVLTCRTDDGKLTPDMVLQVVNAHAGEHMVQPKMVYISNSTEVGTLYTKAELTALSVCCRRSGLYLFLDGARLGCALTSSDNDLTMADIAALTDVFYIGGTKNGALFGEALVIVNDLLKTDFRYLIKQRGAMLAKGWLLGIQFEELFQNHLFYDLAAHANTMAAKLRDALTARGYAFAYRPQTNQLFPIFSNSQIRKLERDFAFLPDKKIDEEHTSVRLVTSWATTDAGIDGFIRALDTLDSRGGS